MLFRLQVCGFGRVNHGASADAVERSANGSPTRWAVCAREEMTNVVGACPSDGVPPAGFGRFRNNCSNDITERGCASLFSEPHKPLSYTSNGRSVWDSKEARVYGGVQQPRGNGESGHTVFMGVNLATLGSVKTPTYALSVSDR